MVLATARAVGLGISQFVSLGKQGRRLGQRPAGVLGRGFKADAGRPALPGELRNLVISRSWRGITRGRGKPVLAVKSGRTTQGAAAASSHTGSLAGGDRAASALFKSCGVIRCNTVAELFALARGFCQQPLPPGDRVAVLTNAGGPGIMATDAAVRHRPDHGAAGPRDAGGPGGGAPGRGPPCRTPST
ncbi:MAG: hypothetical protein R3F43_19245 [bacterium]